MEEHYDWSNSQFRTRAIEALNLAVNCLADVLHGFWLSAGQPIPEFKAPFLALVVGIIAVYLGRRVRHEHAGSQIASP